MALTRIKGSNIADGTVVEADIADNSVTATKLDATLDLSSKSVTLPSASVTAHATNPTKSSIEALGIDVPATDLTGTIPDARFPATLPAIDGSSLTNLPAGGKVLQVVNQNKNSPEYYISTASYTDMFSNSITPTAVGSTFLIFTQINNTRVTSGGDPMRTTLKRGSTEVHTLNTSAGERDNFTDIWLDTTTNADLTARTYTVAGRTTGGGGQSSLQWNRGMFGITIIELGA